MSFNPEKATDLINRRAFKASNSNYSYSSQREVRVKKITSKCQAAQRAEDLELD